MTDHETKMLEMVKFAHEQEAVRQERVIKRLWISTIVLIVALIMTNIGWIIYESQFEDYTETVEIEAEQESDGNGSNYVVGGDYNGETNGEDNKDHKTQD